MPKIVQFLHTAVEAEPLNGAKNIEWNNNKDHRRKFLLSDGEAFNEDGELKRSKFTFWGEWEAQSQVVELENEIMGLPKFLNTPYIDPSVPSRTHNTDPYVFGNRFRYIVCKQGAYKMLRNLDKYSLILFGSRINHKFCLDTVFVVSEHSQSYYMGNIESVFNQRNQYYYASVNPLYDDTKYNSNVDAEDSCRIKPNVKYMFYQGLNSEDDASIFSFVPCKTYIADSEQSYIFQQPQIELDILSQDQPQGMNSCGNRNFSIDEVKAYWYKIKEQVINQGLSLGVKFNNPPLKNT